MPRTPKVLPFRFSSYNFTSSMPVSRSAFVIIVGVSTIIIGPFGEDCK
jgi:hypothetical protein